MADPLVAASGIALWFAFDTIHPDSGPFEYVPGSHRWPIMRRPKVIKYLTKEAYEAARTSSERTSPSTS
ncbi:MAG: phytanoyl-CoA dioxygenase family protein [Myxococcales bacterium]|nr:phytanoyl-CoA dioxygenase family protein [Myxococcales bacterium]